MQRRADDVSAHAQLNKLLRRRHRKLFGGRLVFVYPRIVWAVGRRPGYCYCTHSPRLTGRAARPLLLLLLLTWNTRTDNTTMRADGRAPTTSRSAVTPLVRVDKPRWVFFYCCHFRTLLNLNCRTSSSEWITDRICIQNCRGYTANDVGNNNYIYACPPKLPVIHFFQLSIFLIIYSYSYASFCRQ